LLEEKVKNLIYIAFSQVEHVWIFCTRGPCRKLKFCNCCILCMLW